MVGRRTITINDKEVAIRSYEVSIWTLQDSFITVLKWANLENKGQIQQPKMILDVDGTENFSFSIPMYLKIGEENPAWYNTLNGNLMIGMRKIKVILNKTLEDEAVFEFLITKVTERHETEQLYCDVECEGLAFHELGKIGYKVALSLEEFQFDYEEWFKTGSWKKADGTSITSEPVSNIQYWNEKTGFLLPYSTSTAPVPNKWYYKIEMNWDSYNSAAERESDRVYEDEYVSSWEPAGNTLTPSNVQNQREKCRIVDISESNIYNITQKIAETFGVFCRYEYEYDANYHIISRTVVYYNNFIEEQHGHMDLTYPYHTSEITREMDSSELTTKLFVRPVDYDYSGSGQITILSVDANKSREDYILNFDYLHKFNIITDEQYAEIAVYEKKMHDLNLELEQYAARLDAINNQLIDVDAKKTIATNGVTEAEKQLNYAEDHVKALRKELNPDNDKTENEIIDAGVVTIKTNAPKSVIVLTDENGGLYVKMPFVGIVPSTVKLYDGIIDYTAEDGQELDDAIQITGGTLEYDENFDDLIKISDLPQRVRDGQSNERDISSSLWLTCKYVPYTYWMKISKYWSAEKDTITKEVNDVLNPLYNSLKSELNTLTVSYKTALEEKRVLIKEFEEMMGPALREGYWQPENYNDYGDKYSADFDSISSNNIQGKAKYFYDTNWYSGNNKLSYFEGEQEKQYLVVNLSSLLNSTKLTYIQDHYNDLSFIYCDKATVDLNNELIKNGVSESSPQGLSYIRDMKKSIHIGGECRFSFVQNNNNIFPALIIETSKLMTDDQINFFIENTTSKYYSQIGVLSYDANYHPIVESGAIVINNKNYYITSNAQEVYPRIIINSLSLKSDDSSLLIKLGNTVLTNNEDYSVVINSDQSDLPNTPDKYFIDIKPEVYFKMGNLDPALKINYELSNADILTYLDALQVSKENAQPKVAYTIKLSMYDPYIIHTIYKKMSKIVHINDNQLKFENVQGYISHIEMMLDTPWEDTIEVKNYKTKFEDLFSNIVAQTDSMQKRSFGYDVAAMAFNSDGSLTDSAVSAMLANNISIFNAYLDSHFDTSEVVKDKLTDIFTEAGEVLNSAGNALQDIKALNSKNADILAGFVRGAEEGFAKGIDLISSKAGEYTSAVQINQEGIFIGSDQRVALYSGVIGDDGGTSIELNPQHLLLGVSDDSSGTAAEFTKQHIILAAGGVLYYTEWQQQYNYVVGNTVLYNNNHYKCKTDHISTNSWDSTKWELIEVTGTSSGLVGAKFTKDSIGFATGSGNDINAILMNNNGITLGSGSIDVTLPTTSDDNNNLRASRGSYVRIASSGIELGSLADLYINTNNFKLQTNTEIDENDNVTKESVFAIGTDLQSIDENTTVVNGTFRNKNNQVIKDVDNVEPSVNFLVNKNGAYIKGTVYASAGSFTGNIQATSLTIVGDDDKNTELQHLLNGNIQQQIDDEIQTWTGKGTPVPFGKRTGLNNGANWDNTYTVTDLTTNTNHVNHSEWDGFTKATATDKIKKQHIGDIYYDIATEVESKTAGAMYRWIKNNNDYYWISVGDTVSTKTLELVATARTDLESIFALGRPLGNYFDDNLIYGVNLNTRNGLLIMGNESSNGTIGIFRANHTTMGFFNMEASKVSSSFAYDDTNGLYISSEANFTRDADALLYYKNGNMYISGTLFADDIMVKNRNASGDGVTFDTYLSNTGANLVDDWLSATDYYKLLQGNFSGWDTEHNDSQTFWSNLQNRWNAIDGGVASNITVQNLNTKAINIMNGNTGLAFAQTSNNALVDLSKRWGLIMIGKKNTSGTYSNKYPFFIVSNDKMGFFTTTSIPSLVTDTTSNNYGHLSAIPTISDSLLYFENGDLAISGIMYAKSGWFGGSTGFIIASNEIRSSQATNSIPDIMMKTSASGTNSPVFQLATNGTPLLKFENGQLEVSGTIKAVGGWLGTANNGWIIGTDTIGSGNNVTDVGRIQSANGKLILSAGTISSAATTQNPYILLKNNSNNTIFKVQDGEVEITGTIKASGGWFGEQDGWIIGGNLGTSKNITTIMNSTSGIPQTTSTQTGSRIQSANNKIILNAGSSSTDPYMIMRKDNGSGGLEDVFEYYNGTLALKGDIVATSFQLMVNGTPTNLLDNNGKISSSLINTSGYAINGLTTIGWGIATTNKPQYVALSSTNGLLLGAQKEIVIPRFTPVQLDDNQSNNNTADSKDVIVRISNEGIYFNYYKNNNVQNPTNQIQMDHDGIQMTDRSGELKPIWSQENIIIMQPNISEQDINNKDYWRRSVASIETTMGVGTNNAKHDWVLIRPSYDASKDFSWTGNLGTGSFNETDSNVILTGNNINYEISFYAYRYYATQQNATLNYKNIQSLEITLKQGQYSFWGKYNGGSFSTSDSANIVFSGDSGKQVPINWESTVTTFNFKFEITNNNNYNFCKNENGNSGIKCTITMFSDNMTATISNVRLVAKSPGVTSTRVPCNVYYYK